MNRKEVTATLGIAGLFSIRMLALFMVLPILVLYTEKFPGASHTKIGWVIGLYGLTQAIFQIPLGWISDIIGRRKVIIFGLVVFIVGSLVAAMANSMTHLMIGRALQGAGAIGSTLLAYTSDLTRDEVRVRAMAIIGITIGSSFILAMVLGPLISASYGLSGVFIFNALLGVMGLLWFVFVVPSGPRQRYFPKGKVPIKPLLRDTQLSRLNLSILILHAQFSACFLFIPKLIGQLTHVPQNEIWRIYVPALLGALVLLGPLLRVGEKNHLAKPTLVSAIIILGISQCFLGLYPLDQKSLLVTLVVFFASFSLLEAQLPAWVSKVAPKDNKGLALGFYSTSQFLGIFIGGVVGGLLQNALGSLGVIFWCILLLLLWLICTLDLSAPRVVVVSKAR